MIPRGVLDSWFKNLIHYLVGGFNHLEKYERQWEGWHPIYDGKSNVWNHQPDIYIYMYHINISLLIHTDSTNVPISTNVPDSTNVPISGDCPFSSEISQFPALLSKKTGNPLRFLLKKPHKIEKWVLNVLKPIMLTIPQYHFQKGIYIYIYIDHSQSWVAYYYYFTHMIPSVGGL